MKMPIERVKRASTSFVDFIASKENSQKVQTHNCDFYIHYHPFVQEFFEALGHEKPIKTLLASSMQLRPDSENTFEKFYSPAQSPTVSNRPTEQVEFGFNRSAAYSAYNTELFFHAPILIANRLSQSQRFEEAQKWYHYIFNPTERGTESNKDSAKRFWKFIWFQTQDAKRLEEILSELGGSYLDDWIKNPFLPHIVARYRPQAYMMYTVMKYLDNLIAWADSLFRLDTTESINEAAQLYVLAANILGPKPKIVPKIKKDITGTYTSLKKSDTFGFNNPVYDVELENTFATIAGYSGSTDALDSLQSIMKKANYFCLAPNSKLLDYWDTVGDRLFKIRHSMNLDGIVRDMALFAPPIDPALLISAAAAGIDLGSVLSELQSPMPHYRFQVMLQKAAEFCNEVKAFGGALLSALEKKDAESLNLLRSRHEKKMLDAALTVREKQVDEAFASRDGLLKSRLSVEERYKHYQKLLGLNLTLPDYNSTSLLNFTSIKMAEVGVPSTIEEVGEFEKLEQSAIKQMDAGGNEITAADWAQIPDFSLSINFGGSIGGSIGSSIGGSNVSRHFTAKASGQRAESGNLNNESIRLGKRAALVQRRNDWVLQANLAGLEATQLDRQILASEIRLDIAKKELANQQMQIRQSEEVLAFLDPENPASKFTNLNLYNWMVGKLMELHFQSYRMAYDLAKKAERCYRYELGIDSSNFIKFGYWDNAKKGLLAGEQLGFALKQMEKAYLDQNKREFEITKHISLVHTLKQDDGKFKSLKEKGSLTFDFKKELFDADFEKHYFRRIKSVSISIPCIAGPYTSVSATLRQLKSIVQIKPADAEENKREYTAAISAIATSSAQNDSGMFELNFRDERYLPFEGSGAISDWQLEMVKDTPLLNSITDIIIHLKYTAREK